MWAVGEGGNVGEGGEDKYEFVFRLKGCCFNSYSKMCYFCSCLIYGAASSGCCVVDCCVQLNLHYLYIP